MIFALTVTGRRLSDNREYELKVRKNASSEKEAIDSLDQDFDWEDAATRAVHAQPVLQ